MKPQQTTGNDLFLQLQKERDKNEYMTQWMAHASYKAKVAEARLERFTLCAWPAGALLVGVGVMVGKIL